MDMNELTPTATGTNNGIVVIGTTGSIRAARFDWELEQGRTTRLNIAYFTDPESPADLTGATAKLQIRQQHGATTTLLSLTESNGITLSSNASGNIVVTISAAVAAALSFVRALYDLTITIGGVVTRVLEGTVTLVRQVSV